MVVVDWLTRAVTGHTGRTPSTNIAWYRIFLLEVEQVCRTLGCFPEALAAEGGGAGDGAAAGGAAQGAQEAQGTGQPTLPTSARPGALVQPTLLRALEGFVRSPEFRRNLPFFLPFMVLALRHNLLVHALAALAMASLAALAYAALRTFDCCICMDSACALHSLRNPACGGLACRTCVRHYLASDLAATMGKVRRARSWNVRCFCGCGGGLDDGLALLGTDSLELRELILNLMQRRRYVARCPDGARVVDCPHTDCVGVGYSGQQRVMCFVCERDWDDPNHTVLSTAWHWVKGIFSPSVRLGKGWRPCPHCGAAIEKNGGCRNMRCGYCDRVFLWGPLGNSAQGAVEALAPPSTGGARAMAAGQ